MRCRVPEAKLGFLARLSKSPDDLCGRAVLSLCDDTVDSSCLVRECSELEEHWSY